MINPQHIVSVVRGEWNDSEDSIMVQTLAGLYQYSIKGCCPEEVGRWIFWRFDDDFPEEMKSPLPADRLTNLHIVLLTGTNLTKIDEVSFEYNNGVLIESSNIMPTEDKQIYKTYYPSGQVSSTTEFVGDKMHGWHTEYNSYGAVISMCFYIHGKRSIDA